MGYIANMADDGSFDGFPIVDSPGRVAGLSRLIARWVLVILVLGVVVAAILWIVVKPDVGALTLALTFTIAAGLMVIRQAALAERR